MQHGGPFPATTDSRFGSVGPDAIRRFVRPIAYQNVPQTFLPDELKDGNPLKIPRVENGRLA
jgi:NADP-dependent aldehyde dehydrogenase